MQTWPVLCAVQPSRQDFERLLENEIAAIRVKGLLPEPACRSSVEAVLHHGFVDYENVDPPIGRLGITQFEHEKDEDGYMSVAAQWNATRHALFADVPDPVERVRFLLTCAFARCCDIAHNEEGKPYFAGLVRHMAEALLHLDWAPRDAPGWSIGRIDAQLAWNIYYSVPESGGELVVYNRPWTPDAELSKIDGSYGYDEELVRDRPVRIMRPEIGELIFFNSRNMHRVARAFGSGPRISASSFVGRMPGGHLVLWS